VGINCELVEYNVIKKRLARLGKAPQKTIQQMTAEARKRVPGWVAAEVSKVYGVKKAEITGKKLGTTRVQGSTIDKVKVVYRGRLLTPAHFGMTPKAPKPGGSYTLKATIIRGQRSTLGQVKKLTKKQRQELGKNFRNQGTQNSSHSPIMLMKTGNTREGGTDYIPFQRKSNKRNDIQAIKTVSLPQMVTSPRTQPQIQAVITENLGKRLEHYMDRNLGR
jgi:hypothetical protein